MVNRMKRQSKEWEKIFANHISEKKLVSNYMRDSYNSIAENKQTKTNNLNKNGQRSWVDIFSKKISIWWTGTCKGAQQLSLKHKSKPQIRCHFTVKMTIIKNTRDKKMLAKMWRNVNPYALLVGVWIVISTMENSMDIPQKLKT